MSTSLPLAFTKLLKDSSLNEQRLMLAALTENIARLESDNSTPNNKNKGSDDLARLVEHIEDMEIDTDLAAVL